MAEERERIDDSAFEIEVILDRDSFRLLEEEWNELHRSVRGSYFSQSFDWCDVALDTIAELSGAVLCCVIARQDGRLVLVWPWTVHRKSFFRVARQLGSGFFERQVMLVADTPDTARLVREAWNCLKAAIPADIIELRRMRPEAPLAAILQDEHVGNTAYYDEYSTVEWHEYENWDSYIGDRDRGRMKDNRRKRRRLEEIGHLSFEVIADPKDFTELADWIWQHKRDWMSRTGRQSLWIDRKDYREFLLAINSRSTPVGRLALSVLRLDGRPIAAELSAVDNSWVAAFIGAFDEQSNKYSPGQILQEQTLRWAFEHKLGYDFGVGEESYKKYWINRVGRLVTYTVPLSIPGRFYLSLKPWHTWFAIQVRPWLLKSSRVAIKQLLKR